MELFKVQATGLKAIGLLVVAFAVWVILTGPRFSRLCGDMDGVAKTITFDITTREMRRVVADLHQKSWVDQMHQLNKEQTVNQLRVVITDLKCADTFVMGIVCRANYHLGTGDYAGPDQQDWFRMMRAGKSESWFDYLGPKKTLFNLSPRHCTRE
jgi:hypothetical protein